MTHPSTIVSERLALVSMTPEFFSACLAGDHNTAEQVLGAALLPDWFEQPALMRHWLNKLEREPTFQPWSARAVVLREVGRMIGHIGFHTTPDPDYLKTLAPGGVEFGYTIYPAFRRKGYAREAALALMQWAAQTHQVTRFVLSISPHNVASSGLAKGLGFTQIGEHIDDEDGPENIYSLQLPPSDPFVQLPKPNP